MNNFQPARFLFPINVTYTVEMRKFIIEKFSKSTIFHLIIRLHYRIENYSGKQQFFLLQIFFSTLQDIKDYACFIIKKIAKVLMMNLRI